MKSPYMRYITWVLLIIISLFCWQSYRQLGQAQTHIQDLEAQLDTLRAMVTKYHTLQVAYTEIHSSLSTSHDQLSQLGHDLHDRSAGQLSALTYIKQQLDSIQLAYDSLSTYTLPQMTSHDLSFSP